MRFLFSNANLWLYTLIVVIVSVVPLPASGQRSVPFLDKAIHIVLYLGLSFLYAQALALRKKQKFRLHGFLYAVGIGVSIECVQYLLPYRGFEAADIAANAIGGFLGVIVVRGKKIIL